MICGSLFASRPRNRLRRTDKRTAPAWQKKCMTVHRRLKDWTLAEHRRS